MHSRPPRARWWTFAARAVTIEHPVFLKLHGWIDEVAPPAPPHTAENPQGVVARWVRTAAARTTGDETRRAGES